MAEAGAELMGLTEVAALLGVTRQRAHQLSQKSEGFPAPVARLSAGLIWSRPDVEAWARRAGRLSDGLPDVHD